MNAWAPKESAVCAPGAASAAWRAARGRPVHKPLPWEPGLPSALPRRSTSDPGRDAAVPLAVICSPESLVDILDGLSATTRRALLDGIDHLLRFQAEEADLPATLEVIAHRLLALGLPVDKLTVLSDGGAVPARAIAYRWRRACSAPGRGCGGLSPRLRAALPLGRGASASMTLASADPAGFTQTHRAIVEALMPSIGGLLASRADQLTSARLLRTYLGPTTQQAILSGVAEQGQTIPIRAAILFADMRDSLGQTANIGSVQQMDLLNRFFDCLVPPIEGRGGEVLKFTGDGLLAIFAEQDGGDAAASDALDAARAAFDNLVALNASRSTGRPIELGIGLHYGEAAFGIIGSGQRLDFTVVGRSIGVASRIGDLNKVLAEPLLMSSCFARRLRGGTEPVGDVEVPGIRFPISVLRPLRRDLDR